MDEARIRGEIQTVVELAPPSERLANSQDQEGSAFRSYLLEYLRGLARDLAIPAEVSLAVRTAEPRKGWPASPYRVFLNDRPCRLAPPAAWPRDLSARQAAGAIAQTIHENRELVFSVPLAEEVMKGWHSETEEEAEAGGWPADYFHEFLSLFICRGFRIDRGKEWARRPAENGWRRGPAAWGFEESISGLESTGIKVFLDREQYAGIFSAGEAKSPSPADDRSIRELLDSLREDLFYELGVFLPQVRFHPEEGLEAGEFRLQLNDLRSPSQPGLSPDQFLVEAASDRLSELGLSGEKAFHPAPGKEWVILENRAGALEKCRTAALPTRGPAAHILMHLGAEVKRNAGAFLTGEILRYHLHLLRTWFPALVDAARRRFDIFSLTRILRDLLDEEITIRDLRAILESLLALQGTTDVDQGQNFVFFPPTGNLCPVLGEKKAEDLDIPDWANFVRLSLRRYISHKFTGGQYILPVYLLDSRGESRVRQSHQRPLKDEERRKLVKAIHEALSRSSPGVRNVQPVILTQADVRKKLREMIEKEFPRLAVLSFPELVPEVHIQTVARISWSGG